VYLNVIQTTCPHILRYLSVAVVVNRGRRNALKDLVKVIQQESYAYKDPITEFLEHLYINFDFEGARLKLHECQDVILHDFFIYGYLDEFIESARLMIFETFCRIHQCITSEYVFFISTFDTRVSHFN
jgi:translation initiation factor 3 subunit E